MEEKITVTLERRSCSSVEGANEELRLINARTKNCMTPDKMIQIAEDMEKDILEESDDCPNFERLYVLAHAVNLLKKEKDKQARPFGKTGEVQR